MEDCIRGYLEEDVKALMRQVRSHSWEGGEGSSLSLRGHTTHSLVVDHGFALHGPMQCIASAWRGGSEGGGRPLPPST